MVRHIVWHADFVDGIEHRSEHLDYDKTVGDADNSDEVKQRHHKISGCHKQSDREIKNGHDGIEHAPCRALLLSSESIDFLFGDESVGMRIEQEFGYLQHAESERQTHDGDAPEKAAQGHGDGEQKAEIGKIPDDVQKSFHVG